MSQTKIVTDQTFATDVLGSSKPVLVDYWAEWCGPCKMIGPIIEETARQYEDRVTIAKLNIDENPGTPTRYHVRGIPTLMLFKDGQPVATHVGSLSRGQLQAFIEANTREEAVVSAGGSVASAGGPVASAGGPVAATG